MWFLLVALVGGAQATTVDRVAASVDGEVIALSEIYDLGTDYIDQRCKMATATCVHEMELEVLDALVKRVLIRSELEDIGMRVGADEIDQAIDQVIRENGLADRQELRRQLTEEGIAWDAFRGDMADRMRMQRFQQGVLAPRVVVSQDEVTDAYQRTARANRPLEVTLDALGMLIPADADEEAALAVADKARGIVQAVNAGELEWDVAVEENDEAMLAMVVGGKTYGRGELTADVDKAAFEVDVGTVADPVRVGNVLFVVRVNKRELGESQVVPFDDVKDQLHGQIFQEKIDQVENEWYQRARRLASVEIMLLAP
ncbi:MAG: hypothetical protein GWP91_18250 [Rhodobacterales bacterium]|nr:hypothetical protein [Rhodobacterales bacterium]